MDYRLLGGSGLKVSALGFGAATFGGKGQLFGNMGQSDIDEARRLVDICLEAGVNLFDCADVYSLGAGEEVLGAALKGRRDQVVISTKIGLPMALGPHDAGCSRARLIGAVEAALKRLGTDYIDILHMHAFDAFTPVEEVLQTFDLLIRAGKVRYAGASNFPSWALMKSLAVADRYGWPRYISHQAYYSLIGRDYEWELMPLGLDQRVGAIVWSPLGWGRLTGKIRRGKPLPKNSRLHKTAQFGPPVDDELLYRVVDALEIVAEKTDKTVPQVAIAWLLSRPTVSSVLIGARNEEQLRDNLGAVGWRLKPKHIARLDAASARTPAYPAYPYHAEAAFRSLNPPPV